MKPIITASIGFGYYSLTEEHARAIEAIAPGYELLIKPFAEIDPSLFSRIEVVFGNPPAAWLKNLPNLKFHQLVSAGANDYAEHSVYARDDIILTNGSGIYGQPISEHMLAMMFTFVRGLHLFRDAQHRGEWRKAIMPKDFGKSTVAIVGLGDIGGALAQKSKALGARVIGVKRTASAKPAYVDELYTTQEIDKALPEADFVALCLPSTPQTQQIITRERLWSMKPSAVILNIGRGTAIDQEALIDALRQGVIGGAGLDVTDPEPLPSDNPLWAMENVLITCHSSGRSLSNEEIIAGIFTENMRRFQNGETLNNIVDFELKY